MDKNEISQKTGMPSRKIQYLVTLGIIEPEDRGRGRTINYSQQNLIEIAMVGILQGRNLSLLTIKGIFAHLRRETKRSEYADFFTNSAWGTTKDLLHLRAVVKSGLTHRATVEVGVDYNIPDWAMDYVVRQAAGPITIVPVGKIKIQAMEKLGFIN